MDECNIYMILKGKVEMFYSNLGNEKIVRILKVSIF